ncbi:alpha-2-macroglobulin receptor-associated protein [Plakobranchus ocellatus]|uniref:Alpha-2-macroglobulin receptor-associated protein n=1 Tax=Plakobranchus ocellatus TaxID=259542 RepID=A0AAV4D3U5_9GAST|nr:alpha-2-macroglobulin receptor-associated protein [Plakobranchus ocellatus]
MRALVVVFITVSAFATCLHATKYSKSANLNSGLDYENEERPFRMKKVNMLWAKGKKKLSNVKLADLYAELSVHDKYEAQLKKLKAANKDQDGALEAKVLKSYARIVEHFTLDDSFASHNSKLSNEIVFEEDEVQEKETFFEDPKLQSMWRRAQLAGFSKKDLAMLKEEFQHQQMKINEFNFVFRELGENLEDDDDLMDPTENVVDPEQLKLDMTVSELKDKQLAMTENRTMIREGYMRLEGLMTSISLPEPVFKDDRMHKLWAMAKKTDWSEKELESFKEELKHFEYRLEKQAFYKEQLRLSQEALERKSGEDSEFPEKVQKLQEKNKFFDKTVNKLYADLKSKIDSGMKHYEL